MKRIKFKCELCGFETSVMDSLKFWGCHCGHVTYFDKEYESYSLDCKGCVHLQKAWAEECNGCHGQNYRATKDADGVDLAGMVRFKMTMTGHEVYVPLTRPVITAERLWRRKRINQLKAKVKKFTCTKCGKIYEWRPGEKHRYANCECSECFSTDYPF